MRAKQHTKELGTHTSRLDKLDSPSKDVSWLLSQCSLANQVKMNKNGQNQELALPVEIDEARKPRERSKLIEIEIQPWETSLKRGGKEEQKKHSPCHGSALLI